MGIARMYTLNKGFTPIDKFRLGDPVSVVVLGNSIGCGYYATGYASIAKHSNNRIKTSSAIDSTIRGWVTQMRELLVAANPGSRVYNLSGDGWRTDSHLGEQAAEPTRDDSLAYIEAMVPPPDIVMLPLQINDINIGVSAFSTNTLEIISRIKAIGSYPVIVLENDSRAAGFGDLITEANAIASDENVEVIDMYTTFHALVLAGTEGPYYFDTTHPNAAGHDLMASIITEWFEETGSLPLFTPEVAPPSESYTTPIQITGCTHWWRADQNDQSGGFVSSLNDQATSGGVDFEQSTEAAKPGYDSTGINNLPSLTFDGSSDYMVAGTGSSFNYLHNGTGGTLYMVFRTGATISADTTLFDNVNVTTSNRGLFAYFTSPTGLLLRVCNGSAAVWSTTITVAAATDYQLVITHSTADGYVVRLNGSAVANGSYAASASTSDAFSGFYLNRISGSASLYANATIADIAFFNTVLSGANLTTLESYGTSRYSL